MNLSFFLSLDLQFGDHIYLMNEKGEGFNGNYEGEYDSSSDTFKFLNFSNGKTESIYINKLQDLRKL